MTDERLREAVEAYVAWQYRKRGARRFTLTDLRAALAATPEPTLDAVTLAVAMNSAQITADEIRLGHDLIPVAERVLARLTLATPTLDVDWPRLRTALQRSVDVTTYRRIAPYLDENGAVAAEYARPSQPESGMLNAPIDATRARLSSEPRQE